MLGLDRLGDVVACDTETTGLSRWHGCQPYSIGFCDDERRKRVVRWEVDPFTRKVRIKSADQRELCRLFGSSRRFVFFHGKFDIPMLESIGVPAPKVWDDALVAMHTVKTDENSYELKWLARRYAGYPNDDEKELKDAVKAARREGRKKGWKIGESVSEDYWLAPAGISAKYNLGDCERTMLLHLFTQELLDSEGLRPTYEMEMALQPVVMAMEARGVRINLDTVRKSREELAEKIKEALAKIRKDSGRPDFNPNSYPQKCRLFYGKLGFEPTKRTRKGSPSMDRDSLEEIPHPLARLILEHGKLTKMFGFFEGWEREADENGILHASFEPQAAGTGRFGCRRPNLQQVPKNDPKYAKLARAPFEPRPGHWWVAGDYSQMELRMLAGIAQEEAMLEAFRNNRDIHYETAVRLWGIEAVKAADTPQGNTLRSSAKNVNFAMLYGAGPKRIAAQTGTSVTEAAMLLSNYHSQFPRIKKFMDETIRAGRREGHIFTAYGRRVEVPALYAYKGVNYIIQGSGADVTKRALINMHDVFKRRGGGLVLTIHDEIVGELPERAVNKQTLEAMKHEMERWSKPFGIRLVVDLGIVTERWSEKADVVLAA